MFCSLKEFIFELMQVFNPSANSLLDTKELLKKDSVNRTDESSLQNEARISESLIGFFKDVCDITTSIPL